MIDTLAKVLDAVDAASPRIPTPRPPAAPTARGAEVYLNDWILASPATRAVWCIDKPRGLWRVGLSINDADGLGGVERLPVAQHADYAQCVINAIEIARLAGYE
jgi:hypothetical protein